jgi:L-iditol 2-dehydrogenase
MEAAFLVAAGKYELRSLPDPIAPPDGLVLEVKACGVCGSDLRRWREGPPPGGDGILAGHELAGVVLESGAHLRRFKAGDRLAIAPDVHCGHCYYCQRGRYHLCDNLHLVGISPGYPGGFAQKMLVSAEILENGVVHVMPDGLSFAEAALAEPASSVLAAHDRAGTDLESSVVVLGGGPIGCLHIAVAHARGAAVILSEPSQERRQIAAGFDPEMIVDPQQEDLNARVRAFTSGLGADIVICANPVAATQTQAVEIVRKGGRVVLFGGLPKADPLTQLDSNRIHYGEIEVVGSFSYHPRFHALALDIIRRKLIPAEKLITHTYPLAAVNQAFAMASSGKALKVMVEMDY